RHLDLEFVGIDQVICGHAESRRGHLLYSAAAEIAISIRLESLLIFAAFSSIGFTANPVHSDSKGFMRLFADRAKRHRTGGKALYDFFCGLNFLERYRLVCLLDTHQAAKRTERARLIFDCIGVLTKCLVTSLPYR